jgi:hypothetical protein
MQYLVVGDEAFPVPDVAEVYHNKPEPVADKAAASSFWQ